MKFQIVFVIVGTHLFVNSCRIHEIVRKDERIMLITWLKLHKARMNDLNKQEQTALHVAAYHNRNHIVRKLIEKGIMLHHRDNQGDTALDVAVCQNAVESAKILLSYSCYATRHNCLTKAVFRGFYEMTMLVLVGGISGGEEDEQNALHTAVFNDHYKIAAMLLVSGVKPDCKGTYGETPLYTAVKKGKVEMVRLLLAADYQVDVNSVSVDGRTCLHAAAALGTPHAPDLPMVIAQLLITSGVDVNIRDTELGETALLIAVKREILDVARWLIINGADINLADISGLTPLMHAVRLGNNDMMALLLAAEANIHAVEETNSFTTAHFAATGPTAYALKALGVMGKITDVKEKSGRTPLMLAIEACNGEGMKYLLNDGAQVNVISLEGLTPLHYAVQTGNVNYIKRLLILGAEADIVDNEARTPLYIAVVLGNVQAVEMLLAGGANPKVVGGIPATDALYNCPPSRRRIYYKILALLVVGGADLDHGNEKGVTLLADAVTSNNHLTATLLIALGVDTNLGDETGVTPLMRAAILRKTTLTDLLVKTGAGLHSVDYQGENALHKAVKAKRLGNVKYLAAAGSEINACSANSETPLISAVRMEAKDVVAALLAGGGNPDVKCLGDDQTALFLAVDQQHFAIVNLLIAGNAYIDIKTDGNTPLKLAVTMGQTSIMRMLLAGGADIMLLIGWEETYGIQEDVIREKLLHTFSPDVYNYYQEVTLTEEFGEFLNQGILQQIKEATMGELEFCNTEFQSNCNINDLVKKLLIYRKYRIFYLYEILAAYFPLWVAEKKFSNYAKDMATLEEKETYRQKWRQSMESVAVFEIKRHVVHYYNCIWQKAHEEGVNDELVSGSVGELRIIKRVRNLAIMLALILKGPDSKELFQKILQDEKAIALFKYYINMGNFRLITH